MPDIAQVTAFVPKPLKLQAFKVLAAEKKSFSKWLRDEMENLLKEADRPKSVGKAEVPHAG